MFLWPIESVKSRRTNLDRLQALLLCVMVGPLKNPLDVDLLKGRHFLFLFFNYHVYHVIRAVTLYIFMVLHTVGLGQAWGGLGPVLVLLGRGPQGVC